VNPWPAEPGQLAALQEQLAERADAVRAHSPVVLPAHPLIGGCFVAFAKGQAGPGRPGDEAWVAAVTWRASSAPRDEGAALRGATHATGPRVAADTDEQVVVRGTVPAPYEPGLLAMREGAVLERAVRGLQSPPDVLLVDATGTDHPRRAGLAVHLGWVVGMVTVGVTHRPLRAGGDAPPGLARRGEHRPIVVDGEVVAHWVVTRDGARPLVAHAGWRTDAATAVEVTLTASTPASRTPVPLGEARRAAREARSIAAGAWG
jgi:deoxyribonuclease V